ncbi:MAG: FkbM family methyltransferase [Halobacteriaceae archaeon]
MTALRLKLVRALRLFKHVPFISNSHIAQSTYNQVKEVTIKSFPDQEQIVETPHGFKMELNLSNPYERAIATGTYKNDAVSHFQDLASEGDTVIDVGANIGYYTLMAASEVGRHGEVYSFEPIDDNFSRLERNASINGFDNTNLFNYGLSKDAGKQEMYLPKGRPEEATLNEETWSELTHNKTEQKSTQVVKLENFDNSEVRAAIGDISLVKIDVEGAEFDVLQSMEQTLKENNTPILVTVHIPQLQKMGVPVKKFINYLSDLNYDTVDSLTTGMTKPIEDLKSNVDSIAEPQDFLFVTKEEGGIS